MPGQEHECPKEGCDEVFDKPEAVGGHVQGGHHQERKRKKVVCDWCGDEFEVKSYREDSARFCNQDCMGKWISENMVGEDAGAWSGGEVELECEVCGDEYTEKQHRADRSRTCSEECRYEWVSERMSGKDNHNWEGGWTEYYGPNWYGQRRRARERDGHTCQGCGASKEENGSALSVHHIKPLREFVDNDGEAGYEAANDLGNLVTLCRSCHQKYEGLPVAPRVK